MNKSIYKYNNIRMTASELKAQYELHNPDGHFFTRNNMRFAGDKMSNYYVPAATVDIKRYDGTLTKCYELQRRRPVKGGLNKSAYFSTDSFSLIHGEAVY